MPPNVHNRTDGFSVWFDALPPITKIQMMGIFAVTVLDFAGIIPMLTFVLHWPSIIHRFQIWRIVSHVFVLGPFSLGWLFMMVFLHNHGVPLEAGTYTSRTADFLWIHVFSILAMDALSLLGYYRFIPMVISSANADLLIYIIIYIWSRNFKNMSVSIWGLFKLQAFYLPFAMIAFKLLMGGSIVDGVVGVILGHLFHFLHSIYPRAGGYNLIPTPQILKNFVARSGIGHVNPAEVTARTGPETRAFAGRGRRLAD